MEIVRFQAKLPECQLGIMKARSRPVRRVHFLVPQSVLQVCRAWGTGDLRMHVDCRLKQTFIRSAWDFHPYINVVWIIRAAQFRLQRPVIELTGQGSECIMWQTARLALFALQGREVL